jgi:asparaginyl-tRNA synthetase
MKYVEVCQQFGLTYGEDISSELEKKLVEAFTVPVFVTEYPKELKPFYMKKEGDFAKCFDLIFPTVGELIGGSEREEDYTVLKTEMEKAGLDLTQMQWYLETRKYGSVPHAGFGLGFERLLAFITKTAKIHDTIPFPVAY